jgi:hypothetical protein
MKLEEQVCSLELAKTLKELGVKQESAFWWVEGDLVYRGEWGGPSDDASKRMEQKELDEYMHALFSAFTVAELGELLPMTVYGEFDALVVEKAIRHWFVYYSTDRSGNPSKWRGRLIQTADTEVDACAKMLIYLIENILLTLPTLEYPSR